MIKIYENGSSFYEENKKYLDTKPIETAFFKVNCAYIESMQWDSYAIKIEENGKTILALKRRGVNLLLFGSVDLATKLAGVIYDLNLYVGALLTSPKLGETFLKEYTKLSLSSYEVTHSMDLMKSDKCMLADESMVEKASLEDANEIYNLENEFMIETNINMTITLENVKEMIDSTYLIRKDGVIASTSRVSKRNELIASIGSVFTRKEYRGQGLAKILVSALRNKIVKKNMIAYLYVDKKNPISNHVYSSIGFEYMEPSTEFRIKEGPIRRALLAGGCFWCISNALQSLNGVIELTSGYSGGRLINPKYEEVKSGKTKHREAILVKYDSTKLSYTKLLNAFFVSIDPFDGEGQFIDRGENYQTAVFTSNKEEIEIYNSIKKRIEDKYKKEVKVSIFENMPFFEAEEYHQNFSKNNPEMMKKELEKSGRMSFDYIIIEDK